MATGPTSADLRRDYGLSVSTVAPHAGGFESRCFVADDTWFIRVWRDTRLPARLDLLVELRDRGLPVPAPLPTTGGMLHSVWEGQPYAVFEYVHGHTAGEGDWDELARALQRIHSTAGVDVPRTTLAEPDIRKLKNNVDHPWVRDRRDELVAYIERLERVITRAKATTVEHVLCHQDFGGSNVLIRDGEVVAIIDWEQVVLGPREHDLWIAAEERHGEEMLRAYGAHDLNRTHLEYALLARALRDIAARLTANTDQEGVTTWGFRRLDRLSRDLALFSPFCS